MTNNPGNKCIIPVTDPAIFRVLVTATRIISVVFGDIDRVWIRGVDNVSYINAMRMPAAT